MSWETRQPNDRVECPFCYRRMPRRDYFQHRKAAEHPRSTPNYTSLNDDFEATLGCGCLILIGCLVAYFVGHVLGWF